MINAGAEIAPDTLAVLEGVEMRGQVNTTDEVVLTNIRASIRRGHTQLRPQPLKPERVVIVGGGPSLDATLPELVALIHEGAKLVTVNGSYQWCLDRNLTPKMQFVVDARPSNARFLEPALPECRYLLASQCAPETWDAVEGRPHVAIFHAAAGTDGPMRELLDGYYLGNWFGVGGGTTVVTRAISALRTIGYLRFDLFGVDCCFLDGVHHAYPQVENERDQAFTFTAGPSDRPDLAREFRCAPWHVKQLECMLQMIRVNGDHFQIEVHGDGLLAYALRTNAIAQQALNDTGVR